jgi:hypothetical protein
MSLPTPGIDRKAVIAEVGNTKSETFCELDVSSQPEDKVIKKRGGNKETAVVELDDGKIEELEQ